MNDLNAVLFYKAKLELAPTSADADLLWILVMEIREWMGQKWERNGDPITRDNHDWSAWKTGGHIRSASGKVNFLSAFCREDDGTVSWACRIIENMPARSGYAPREWTTELGFRQEPGSAACVDLILYYRDRSGFIGLCEEPPEASVPRIVRRLFTRTDVECRLGTLPLSLSPARLEPDSMPDFLNLVSNPERRIPIVYISPAGGEAEGGSPILNPEKTADILGPNALVFYGASEETFHAMSEVFPSGFSCSGGIRIYAPEPHFEDAMDQYRHRYLNNDFFAEHGADCVLDILRRALAQDVHFYDTMLRIEDCQRLRETLRTRRELAEWRERTEVELLTSAEADMEAVRKERDEQMLQNMELEDQIKQLRDDLYNANALADSYRDEARTSGERKKALDELRNIAVYPETAQDIAAYFVRTFPDRIAFSNDGLASLKTCSTKPAVLWDALYQMCTVLYDLYASGERMNVDKEFSQRSTFSISANSGSMTKKNSRLMQQYVTEYEGRQLSIESHLKYGSKESDPRFIRVYYAYDAETQKLVIGSCGQHLENYSTQFIH